MVKAFVEALLDTEAWARFGRRVFKRVVVIGVVGIAFAGITWVYSSEILLWLLKPAGDSLSPLPGGSPVFTAPQDMFMVEVNLAFRGGALAAFPVFIVSVYTLFSKWLPPHARTFVKLFVPSIFLVFAAGVVFVYFVILPTSLEFLLGRGEGVATPLISVTHYFEMVLSLMFWVGVLFELPLVMYMLARLELVSYRQFKWARLAVWFFAPFLAAIITPSFDAWTWGLVLVPLVILYEFGMFLAWTTRPEEGNYLWLKKVSGAVNWFLRTLRALVISPVTVPRWAFGKALDGLSVAFRRILGIDW